jgi:hypothetical protein
MVAVGVRPLATPADGPEADDLWSSRAEPRCALFLSTDEQRGPIWPERALHLSVDPAMLLLVQDHRPMA